MPAALAEGRTLVRAPDGSIAYIDKQATKSNVRRNIGLMKNTLQVINYSIVINITFISDIISYRIYMVTFSVLYFNLDSTQLMNVKKLRLLH